MVVAWLAPASGVVGFLMAWAIGAQDVANALGTSVGSKALTEKQAIIVGGVFEFLGALMGSEVASTISTGIISPDSVETMLYARIMFCTLAGAFVWLAFATYFSLPVSTTHSLVGSLIGLSLINVDSDQINFDTLKMIMLSWVTSPGLGFIISYVVFSIVSSRVLKQANPLVHARRVIPYFYGVTSGILTLFLFTTGPRQLRPTGTIAVALSVLASLLGWMGSRVHIANRRGHAKKTDAVDKPLALLTLLPPSPEEAPLTATQREKEEVSQEAESLFSGLMVVTACVVAFAHGSNDVSNSIGPFAAVMKVTHPHAGSQPSATPLWILVGGGLGIVIGLATYGYKCMATVGSKITKLTFSRGFAAQIGTAMTVLAATMMGLSVSTTHCLVGAIGGVAVVDGGDSLNKATLYRIAASWVITMPASALASTLIFLVLRILGL